MYCTIVNISLFYKLILLMIIYVPIGLAPRTPPRGLRATILIKLKIVNTPSRTKRLDEFKNLVNKKR